MTRLYFIVVCFLGMFGCMASNLSRVGSSPDKSRFTLDSYAERNGIRTAEAEARDAALTDEIILDRHDDGHFYADVEINGTPIEMLVDTGASGVALSEADARKTGIATTIGMSDHVGEGAGGAVYGNVVRIDRIRLGDTEAEGVDGVVLRGGDMSLLGQDFLRRFESVEIKGDRMVLR
jgi:aspartyl protease family protein